MEHLLACQSGWRTGLSLVETTAMSLGSQRAIVTEKMLEVPSDSSTVDYWVRLSVEQSGRPLECLLALLWGCESVMSLVVLSASLLATQLGLQSVALWVQTSGHSTVLLLAQLWVVLLEML